jgi:quinol monooxygenase YgiN
MSIIAILDVPVQPGRRADALAALLPALGDSRAFDGNQGIDILLDDNDENHFLILERWRSAEDQAAYQAWRATPEGLIAGFGEALAGPPSTKVYSIGG